MLALGHKGLGAIRFLDCGHVLKESSFENGNDNEPKLAAPVGLTTSSEENEVKNVSYSYTLWVGSNVSDIYSLQLISPKNTSFFRAMTQAAEFDSR